MSKRKFEKISFESFKKSFEGFPNEVVEKIYNEVKLPKRSTKYSAGYDIFSPIDFALEPNNSIIVPTGIKVYLP